MFTQRWYWICGTGGWVGEGKGWGWDGVVAGGDVEVGVAWGLGKVVGGSGRKWDGRILGRRVIGSSGVRTLAPPGGYRTGDGSDWESVDGEVRSGRYMEVKWGGEAKGRLGDAQWTVTRTGDAGLSYSGRPYWTIVAFFRLVIEISLLSARGR
ncbi:hypothetical protein D9611_012355 [Ephemerocybe angulata]|uniref:Uncharacterized protein n=1 Tax=Ephemerocybe angulata TaxID=980116 RepID=A0A8H5FK01_9AGAR|nr:hypothetical protein D9611_012355 [Tulosesus angulatus]